MRLSIKEWKFCFILVFTTLLLVSGLIQAQEITGQELLTHHKPRRSPPTVPILISPPDSAFLNDTTVSFLWHASIDIETSVAGYYFGWSTDPTFSSYDTVLEIDTFLTVTFTDTTWYWAVKAVDTEGEQSLWSEVRTFSFDFSAPDPPLLISPINESFVFDSSVIFVWQPVVCCREVPSPVTYVVQIDTTGRFSSSMMTMDTTASTTITLGFLTEGYCYYWRVKAYDAAGNQGGYSLGTYSRAGAFMLDLHDPLIDGTYHSPDWWPGPFDIFSQVTDIWGIDEVVMHYKRTEDPAFFPDTMSEGSDNWYLGEIPALTQPADTVKYWIYARDNAGRESRDPPTDYHYIIPHTFAGESPDTLKDFVFSLRNNPIKGKAIFVLSLPKNCLVTLEVFDISGRLLDTPFSGIISAGTHEITWSPERTGIYFYCLKLPWKTETGKMISIR